MAIKFLLGTTHQPEQNPSADQQSPTTIISKQVDQVKSLLALGKLAIENKQLLNSLNIEGKETDTSIQQPAEEKAEIFYRWKDKDGFWHFSQTKPKNKEYIIMKVGEGPVLPSTKETQEADPAPANTDNETAPSFMSKLAALLEQVKKSRDTTNQ